VTTRLSADGHALAPTDESIFGPRQRSMSAGILILVTLIAFEAMALAGRARAMAQPL
jgi:hypothetical protein